MAKKQTRAHAYRDALINIWKLSGRCYDQGRLCSDPQAVAGHILKKYDPKIYKDLDQRLYVDFDVTKKGRLKIKKKI